MKLFFLLSLSFLLSACTVQQSFRDKDVCYLVYDLKNEKYEEVFNQKRCEERFPAVSTFKVPLSVMAFDSGVFIDEKTPLFKWDGNATPIDSWNKDHIPLTWMRDSVVWMSQAMTPKIGMEKIQRYLKSFEYGNQDFSGGLKYSWLTPAPFIKEPMKNSLKISAYEQIRFLKKLWRGELSSTKASQELTKKLMTPDISPAGNTLIGKTGSGFRDENHDVRLGWYVAHLQNKNAEYLVVVNFTDKTKQPSGTFGGREAKEIAMKLLSDKGLW
jgi:beta-lactamase class D